MLQHVRVSLGVGRIESLTLICPYDLSVQDFPSELVRFSSLNTSWLKLMKATSETRNVMNCCLGGDSPKTSLLDKLQQDLEECRKSLSTYLIAKKQVQLFELKRKLHYSHTPSSHPVSLHHLSLHSSLQAFPRFHFISDSVLLSILSAANSVESIQPYLTSMFGNMAALTVTHLDDINRGPQAVISSVTSIEGEELMLVRHVPMVGDVESWLGGVVEGVQETLKEYTADAIHSYADTALEDFVQKVRICLCVCAARAGCNVVNTRMQVCMEHTKANVCIYTCILVCT